MADWEEIKRLAADFQRTQTSDTLQRISERNCIDIVKKLIDLQLIELIYTRDGKEFLTPAHLMKEIEDDIYINGGKMPLDKLATNLNVDYQHIENKVKELARDKSDEYSLILGHIIHSSYKTTLGKEIKDYMLINGQLSIADFAKTMDLPSEFLFTIVKEILPKVMDEFVVGQDERTYYTIDVMDKYRSIIAGTLSAILRPTSIASLIKRLDISERIFTPIVEGLIKDNRIDATVENRLFIPAVHAREQNEWINTFYSSNSYVGYDVLTRMDFKQPKAYLKKRFPDGIALKTCIISPNLLSQVESLIEDTIASNTFIDITTIVPSALDSDDIESLLQDIFKRNKSFQSSTLVFDKTNVCSLGYIATCRDSFKTMMETKANDELKQGKLINHFLGSQPKIIPRRAHQHNEDLDPKLNDEVKSSDIISGQSDIIVSKTTEQTNPESSSKPNDGSNKNQSDDESDQGGKNSNKKGNKKKGAKSVEVEKFAEDSDEEDKGGKKSKSRKSGGGAQGREIKQKSVKKKYVPGNKGNQKRNNDGSDEESMPSKTPRSSKGRAARRGMSPERDPEQLQTSATKTKVNQQNRHQQQTSIAPQQIPLVFMDRDEIVSKLKQQSRGGDEFTDEFHDFVAKNIEEDLNSSYRILAKQVFDEYLKSQSEDKEPSDDDAIELVE